jgi:hypothetical protein
LKWTDAVEKEGSYAQQEYQAFVASWLQAFDGLLYNPPVVNNLSGIHPEKAEWLSLAERSGFSIPANAFYVDDTNRVAATVQLDTRDKMQTAVVLDNEVVNAPSQYHDACLLLSKRTRLPLLCIYFVVTHTGEYVFAGATGMPDFQHLPPAFLSLLHHKIEDVYAK